MTKATDPTPTDPRAEDPLAGQRLTIRSLDWANGHVNLTLCEKDGRPIAHVQSGVEGPCEALLPHEAREWAQALVMRFNLYDHLMQQLARPHTAQAGSAERTPANERIEALADELQAKIEQTKRDLEQFRLDYLNEVCRRQLVSENRDELEEQLAKALVTIERWENPA